MRNRWSALLLALAPLSVLDGFFLGPGFPRAYREAKEGPLKDES